MGKVKIKNPDCRYLKEGIFTQCSECTKGRMSNDCCVYKCKKQPFCKNCFEMYEDVEKLLEERKERNKLISVSNKKCVNCIHFDVCGEKEERQKLLNDIGEVISKTDLDFKNNKVKMAVDCNNYKTRNLVNNYISLAHLKDICEQVLDLNEDERKDFKVVLDLRGTDGHPIPSVLNNYCMSIYMNSKHEICLTNAVLSKREMDSLSEEV